MVIWMDKSLSAQRSTWNVRRSQAVYDYFVIVRPK